MNCTITNLSAMKREHWCVLTLPRSRAASLPNECAVELEDGRTFRAVRGRSVGLKTTYRVRALLGGGESARGWLVPSPVDDAKPFIAHPWVGDDLLEMLPLIGVPGPAMEYVEWAHIDSITEVDSSPAHKRFRIEQHVQSCGLRVTLWIDVLHDDPVATFTGRIVWSDRADPANQRTFERLLWKCGECAVFDFGKRCGIQDPVQVGRDWLTLLNTEPVTFGDGVAIALAGRILSFVSNEYPPPGDPGDPFDPGNLSVANLMAGAGGPVLAVCHDWEHSWLAAKNRPRITNMLTPLMSAEHDWVSFSSLMQQRAGWFGDRPYGLSRMPGQTGNQADFGATKGTAAVVAMDPRAIYVMQHGAHGDVLRGYTHYGSDGQPLRVEDHPGWVSWGRTTHWSLGVSSDRLGKNSSLPFPTGGFVGVDDEHMSHNYLAAYMALADDPLLEDQLRFLLTTDRASYRMRFPNNGGGASRAQGRTAGAWAQLACVADDQTAQGFAELLTKRVLQTNQSTSLNVTGPMKVPAFGGPDPRKPIYTTAGVLGPWASFWELGLFLVGFVQMLRRGIGTLATDELARGIALKCAQTMARFGCFLQNGQWHTVGDMLWSGGEPPPGGLVRPSPHLTSEPHIGDVLSWTFAGILAARELLPRESEEWQKLNACIEHWTQGQEAVTCEGAEWWAIADAIVAPPTDASAADVVQ